MLLLSVEAGVIVCCVWAHVDDVVMCWAECFPIQTVRDAFKWGAWKQGTGETTCCGRELDIQPRRVVVRQ
eukprot:11850492-Alexandrium_andersonii.AAC.1